MFSVYRITNVLRAEKKILLIYNIKQKYKIPRLNICSSHGCSHIYFHPLKSYIHVSSESVVLLRLKIILKYKDMKANWST